MRKKLLLMAATGALAAPLGANAAGAFLIGHDNIKFDGGITGSYMYESDPGSKKQDTIQATDFILQFEREAPNGGVGFTAGVGSLVPPYLGIRGINYITGSSRNLGAGVGGNSMDLYYGWVRVRPFDHFAVDVGRLESHVGYETDLTYQNRNIMLGLVRGNQPVFYDGARFSYWYDGIGLYIETDKDVEPTMQIGEPIGGSSLPSLLHPGFTEPGINAVALGAEGEWHDVKGEFNFFSSQNDTRIFDIVAETHLLGYPVAANVDFILKSDALKQAMSDAGFGNSDDGAFGAALYATIPVTEKFAVPVRFEYVNDGTSGLYGLGYPAYPGVGSPAALSNSAISFTITPTYNFNVHTFVRAEISYTTMNKTKANAPNILGFRDTDGNPTDSNTVFVLQAGTRF